MRRAWADAEALGVDCLFNWDHFFPLAGEPDGKHFEALTVLGAMAEVTQRVELGSLVICNSYRNPDYLADGVEAVEGDEVTLETVDALKPAVVRSVEGSDYLYLLMPVRVS